ncbi:MAG: adenylyl-sulfate kinase [Minisyncoccota bacterium]
MKKFEKIIILDGDELRKGLNADLGFSLMIHFKNA